MDPHKCIFSIFTIQDTINSVSHKIIRQDIYHIFPRNPVNNECLFHVFNKYRDNFMRFYTKWLTVMDPIFVLLWRRTLSVSASALINKAWRIISPLFLWSRQLSNLALFFLNFNIDRRIFQQDYFRLLSTQLQFHDNKDTVCRKLLLTYLWVRGRHTRLPSIN